MPVSPPSGAATPAAASPRTVLLRRAQLSVVEYRCASGPDAKPFVEQHRVHSISYVRRGGFGCRCRGRTFELVTGALFIGYPGDEYSCTHEHPAGGDECLSFQFTPDVVDELGDVPEAWRQCAVPPLPALVVLGELAQAAAAGRADIALDEVGLLLARRLVTLASSPGPRSAGGGAASATDRQRAMRAALWIAANATEAITLDQAAAEACLSPFHFLRVFSRVFGLTPHQYLIRRRLAQAARLLAEESLPVTDVAFQVGFGDLSNFVRTFGQAAGLSPSGFRRLARGERRGLQQRLAAAVLQ